MFQDRTAAGRSLAEKLQSYKLDDPIVVALPRGGVPVGYEVALLLKAPLDVRVVRKLGYPGQPELAIGAIVDGAQSEIVMNDAVIGEEELPSGHLEQEICVKLDEIRTLENAFRNHRPALNLLGRTLIVVDDGLATGATMRVVVKRLRKDRPRKIVVAVPVSSIEAVELLKNEADEIVCLDVPDNFIAVGSFYREFNQVSNEEVTRYLDLALVFI